MLTQTKAAKIVRDIQCN